MNILKQKFYKEIFEKYIHTEYFFPLIAAVLDKKQDGIIISNNNIEPTSFLIIHKFGFAQFFEIKEDKVFDNLIINYIFDNGSKDFLSQINKIRLYYSYPKWSTMLDKLELSSIEKSKRVRLTYENHSEVNLVHENYRTLLVDLDNVDLINKIFNLDFCKRFWASCNDAIINSKALILSDGTNFLSICYAAAISNKFLEIDIATNSAFRNQGFAKILFNEFLIKCKEEGITPLWDCYKNNLPSYNLAINLNFKPMFEYDFYTMYILDEK